ncbi:MAG: extracellular solute-binding protein [Defluviitaleaceae bacterium]|nr:extracellular solute-binding protein [Defluviitaleaceae bacterium]
MLSLLLIAVFVFSLAACQTGETAGGAPELPPPPPPGAAAEEINLTWTMWDAHLIPYYQVLLDAYKEIAPHVNIELVDLGTAEYETILQTHLIGGAEYDIVKVRGVPSYINKLQHELLMPLDGFISDLSLDMSGFVGFEQQLVWEGSLYTLPIRRDHWVVFYNKDLFDMAGVDYPTNELTVAGFDALIRELGEALPEGYWANLYHWWASVVHLFGILDGTQLVDGVYDWMIPYYEMVIDHQQKGYAPAHADLTVGNIHYSVPWYNGQGAMIHMGSWFIAMKLDALAAGNSVVDNWGIVNFPVPEGVAHGTAPAGFTGLAIGRNSRNAEAAMDFLAFASGPLGAEAMVSVGQFPGMMTDAVVDRIVSLPNFPQDDASRQALQPVAAVLDASVHPLMVQANSIIGTAHTEIMTGNATIEEGIEMINQQFGRDILGLE